MSISISELGPFVLRLALAVIFIYHGYGKLFGQPGPKGFGGWLASMSIPAPLFMAYVVGAVEFFGGLALALGLFTRLVAVLLLINMLVAIAKVHWPKGFEASKGGVEFPFALEAGVLALVFTGPGAFALGSFGLPF